MGRHNNQLSNIKLNNQVMLKQTKSYRGFQNFQSENHHFVPPYVDKTNLNQNNQKQIQEDSQQTPISQSNEKRNKMLMERAGINMNKKQVNFTPRKKWGKMLVIHDGNISITLGPDYWCFIPTFICFCGVAFGVIYLVLMNVQSVVGKISAFIVCLGQLLSYLLVATSNPGVVFGQPAMIQQLGQIQKSRQSKKYCKKCRFQVPKSTYHCRDCDVCIQGYDHHCPWTSKCIGSNNLCRFYTFLLMTPIFLVYICVTFIMCMSQQVHQIGRPHITTSTHNIHNF